MAENIISLDTETTGLDWAHSARPFFITSCNLEGEPTYWQWDVDPLTREVSVPEEEVLEVRDLIRGADRIVLQNGKFDYHMLRVCNKEILRYWDWGKVEDTIIAGHLLASGQKHDLTSMAVQYLRLNIQHLEDTLKDACNAARRWVRRHNRLLIAGSRGFIKKGEMGGRGGSSGWMIAAKGLPGMPSANAEPWKMDTWLPRTIALSGLDDVIDPDHPWATVLRDYANGDSAVTVQLWRVMEKEIRKKGLWGIYRERMRLIPVAVGMEERGVSISRTRLEDAQDEYLEQSQTLGGTMVAVADSYGHELRVPKGASVNQSLTSFCFDVLKLPPVRNKKARTSRPTLNSDALDYYLTTLDPKKKAYRFVKALRDKRKRDSALAYMAGYERFWVRRSEDDYVLYPFLNPTGTATLRWSSSAPNEQNVSKKEGFNLRQAFGPAPGREWWSLDAQNLELRIPTFEAEEEVPMKVFLNPKEPPYFGSYHLVVFDFLYPELFAKHGAKVKDLYESTFYQWVKNGNFAVIYGAQEETADRTYRVSGAYKKIRYRFPKIAKLSDRMVAYAEKHGYVETIPDRSVCPERGYPVQCSRSEWGRISPTVPLNYHIQSTACWWMGRAMVRCEEKLAEWRDQGFDAFITMQVHDELVFDFPKSVIHPRDDLKAEKEGEGLFRTSKSSNLWRIRILQKLMETGGEDISVPTPVAVGYNENNWADEEKL